MNSLKNKHLVSIIVPVYNAEKFLPRCLNSILNQTHRNLEIILINDGSSDSSGCICEEFQKKDSRIVYYSQENHGQGYTRSRGVELSKGDYVAFVDNDDYMLPTMYETMLESIVKADADVCVCQWNYELPDGTHTINNKNMDENFYGCHSSIEFARNLYKNKHKDGYANGVVVSPWNKLFKKEIIKGVKMSGYLGEDEEMADWINSKNCKVVVIPDEFYYWCQNLDSMSNKPFSAKRFHFLDALENRCKLFSDEYIVRETEVLYCNIYIEYFYKAEKAGIIVPKNYYQTFLKMFISSFKHQYSPAKFYVRAFVFTLSPSLYKKIAKIG